MKPQNHINQKTFTWFCIFLLIASGNLLAQDGNLPTIEFDGKTIQVFPTDHPQRLPWGPANNTSGANSTHDGRLNTQTIVEKYAGWNNGNYAARICAQLNAYGYDDWYLPSAAEMAHIFGNRNKIQGLYQSSIYWTSTEEHWGADAAAIDLASGIILNRYKDEMNRVRCLRNAETLQLSFHQSMPPLLFSNSDLPLKIEGYTSGAINDALKNIYDQGGIQISIDALKSVKPIQDFVSGNFYTNDINESFTGSFGKIKTGQYYLLTIKVDKGSGYFDSSRRPLALHAPSSQVYFHFPANKVYNDPVISVNGTVVAKELTKGLVKTLTFKVPKAGNLAYMLTQQIGSSIKDLFINLGVNLEYRDLEPVNRVEINENLSLGEDINEFVWYLGGWQSKDYLSINTAEINYLLKFEEPGTVDLSMFFSLYGRHAYDAPSNPLTMSITSGVLLHRFLQHIVLRVDVEEQEKKKVTDAVDGIKYGMFGVTNERYKDDSDWNQIVMDVFGPEYRVADWNDLRNYYNNGGNLLQLFDGLGLTERGNSAYVTRNGKSVISGTRYYFATRHEHRKPSSYLAHENIENFLISLGSWPGSNRIMVIRRDY